ncbi:MAG: protein translocase subunit SecD [Gammaproteobacteria bacterium]|nr:protein translocase subunit SecD [Gammaproteobacteria bacterium]
MNQYPLWKYLLIVVVMAVATVYALPNLYGDRPVVQVAPARSDTLAEGTVHRVETVLKDAGIAYQGVEPSPDRLSVLFSDTETQMRAQDLLKQSLGDEYTVALNLVPATPAWLKAFNAVPMYLGLDLRGGVHFLMQVDMKAVLQQADERYISDLRDMLRKDKVRYRSILRSEQGGVDIQFTSAADRSAAQQVIGRELPALVVRELDEGGVVALHLALSDQELREAKRQAVLQNVTTLRNRVNELGVAEPVIQQQGLERIVVQLPGVQDPARAKEILGATATLEFRLVDTSGDVEAAVAGRVPVESKLYRERNGTPLLLKKRIIVTGDQIIDAASGIDSQSGTPAVFITLDGKGAAHISAVTKDNIGKPMAVVFIENKPETRMIDGVAVHETRTVQEVINVATIRDQLSKRFQISGLDSTREARDLALLLRAGALSAPMEIIEERTVGPSLGQDNIDQGLRSVIVGFVLVMVFMVVWYRMFGMVANLALLLNVVLITAVMSLLQFTLTLPGIAGIVLTIGMAVDANVLIFERIKEELRNGNTPHASIHAGYDKAFATITDSNLTTLLATMVLYAFGTGPIKGFAVTLSIGILTSMFTAILGTRAIINLAYGGRKLTRLGKLAI